MDDWGTGNSGNCFDNDAQEQWGDLSPGSYSRERFHLPLFFHALVGGAVGTLIGLFTYSELYDAYGSNIVMVGAILAAIAACVLLACGICEMNVPRLTRVWKLSARRMVLLTLAGAAAAFAIGCLCEFLYELNRDFDLVFAIDDSASMESNDPGNLRYNELEALIDQMSADKRVGLLRFSTDIQEGTVELAPLDAAHRQRLRDSLQVHIANGQTDINKALETALELCQRGGRNGRLSVVVLLSDGCSSTEVPVSRLVREYVDTGAAISTVSLGAAADEAMMKELAQRTGGTYLKVEKAGDLADAFRYVSTRIANRCLFTERPGVQRSSVLYFILRVLFLALPGLAIGLFIMLMLQEGGVWRQIVVSGAAGLLSGLVMELGTFFSAPHGIILVISWMLYGVVLLDYMDRGRAAPPSSNPWDGEDIKDAGPTPSRPGEGEFGRLERRNDWGGR